MYDIASGKKNLLAFSMKLSYMGWGIIWTLFRAKICYKDSLMKK